MKTALALKKRCEHKKLSDTGLLHTPAGLRMPVIDFKERDHASICKEKLFFVYFNMWDQSSGPSVAYVME